MSSTFIHYVIERLPCSRSCDREETVTKPRGRNVELVADSVMSLLANICSGRLQPECRSRR